MPIPSFDELLSQANEVSQIKADNNRPLTSELIAKGLSQFVSTLLSSTDNRKRETYTGTLSDSGEYSKFDQPRETGIQNVEALFGSKRLRGSDVEDDQIPITQEQAFNFALEGKKQKGRENLFNAKERARKEVASMKVGPGTVLGPLATQYVMRALGEDYAPEVKITKQDADIALRARGVDSLEFWRGLGIETSLATDPLVGIDKKDKKDLQGKVKKKQFLSLPPKERAIQRLVDEKGYPEDEARKYIEQNGY